MIQLNTTAQQQKQVLNALGVQGGQGNAGNAAPATGTRVSISQEAYNRLRSTPVDRTPPKVTKFAPTDNAKNVRVTANITLRFSEAIQKGSGNIVLRDAAGTVVETFDIATSNRIKTRGTTLKIDPTLKLQNGTRYFVDIEAGVVTDKAGNAYKGTTAYDFTTVREKIRPKVVEFFPRDANKGVSPTQDVYVSFNEHIKAGKGSIAIVDAKGKVVEKFRASSGKVNIEGNILTINPAKDFKLDSKYFVKFDKGAIVDLAGNAWKGSRSYDFKTATSNIAPTNPNWTPMPAPTVPTVPTGGGGGGVFTYSDNPYNAGAFNIALDYTGDQAYLTYFDQARSFWQNVITTDLPDINGVDDLRITASIVAIDGAGGVLGSAGPTQLRGGSYLPYLGQMRFDSADMANMVSNGSLLGVIKHEMGHVLGLGALWGTFGFNSVGGQYTGANALAEYRNITGTPGAAFIPLEDNGGAGTANAHWEEDIFTSELMTGYATGAMNLSRVSIGALADLGYSVNYGAAQTGGLNIQAPGGNINLIV